MFLTTARSALSPVGDIRLDRPALPLQSFHSLDKPQQRDRAPGKRLRLRSAAHPLFADAGGLWAWAADDAYAAPTRHATVQSWMELHPRSNMQLWLSADLMADSPEQGAAVRHHQSQHFDALKRIDLQMMRLHARRHAVEVQSVAAWWSHALVEAQRCVPALLVAALGQVCVVEGRQIAWISSEKGTLQDFRQITLGEPTVAALQAVIEQRDAERGAVKALTVALGHGLHGGHRTHGLDAHVLGRLDGHQPPHWLRPSARTTPN